MVDHELVNDAIVTRSLIRDITMLLGRSVSGGGLGNL